MNAKTCGPVLLPAGKQQGSSRSRKAGVGRPRALPARRPPADTMHGRRSPNRHADAVEAALTTAEGTRTSPASEPPASLPASIAVIRAGMEFTGVETRPPRTAGHGADLRPPARQGQDESQGQRQAVLSVGPARLLWARHQPGAGQGAPQGLRQYHLRHLAPSDFRRARAA